MKHQNRTPVTAKPALDGSIQPTFSDEDLLNKARELDHEELVHDLQAQGSATLGDFPADPPATPVELPPPDPYLVQTLSGLVDAVTSASKAAGWSGVSVPGMIGEDDWKNSVTTTGAVVVQKRFPKLAQNATPEAALMVLTFPWVLWAGGRLIGLAYAAWQQRKMKLVSGSTNAPDNGDPRRNGHGENFSPDGFIETSPADLPI